MEHRSLGRLASMSEINSRASAEMSAGHVGLPVEMTRMTSFSLQPKKGNSPDRSTYSSTPMLQMSTGRPKYFLRNNTSGAICATQATPRGR